MEVGIGDDHTLADLAEGEGKVVGHRRLAFLGQRARHQDATERHLFGEHLELDPKPPKGIHEQDVVLL